MAEINDLPIPPANFSFLVESVLMQTQMQLGLFHFGEKEEGSDDGPNLPLARHSIDMLAMLQDKTKGNLTMEEQRLLENGLTELRFRYVQVVDEQKRKNEPRVVISDNVVAAGQPDGPRIILPDGGKGTKTS